MALKVVEEALRDNPGFHIVNGLLPEWKDRGITSYRFGESCLRGHPATTLSNGFFVAVLEKNEEGEAEETVKPRKAKRRKLTEKSEG